MAAFFCCLWPNQWVLTVQVDSICLPMLPHCDSFSIGPRRPLPHVKLSGTNLKIGACRVKFLVKQPNGRDRAPPGLKATDKVTPGLLIP